MQQQQRPWLSPPPEQGMRQITSWPCVGLVIARGEVCGRAVHACYLDTGSIALSSQPAASRALCNMVDAAILVNPAPLTRVSQTQYAELTVVLQPYCCSLYLSPVTCCSSKRLSVPDNAQRRRQEFWVWLKTRSGRNDDYRISHYKGLWRFFWLRAPRNPCRVAVHS